MSREFWRGKRVFLTGHTGFKGGWLSLWLQQLGADVCGFSLDPPTEPNLFNVAQVADGMTSVKGDITEPASLNEAMQHHNPDIVFHLAAQPLVRYSYDNPVETYTTNVLGTVHVLEAVRRCSKVRSVLCITTDKCYENREWVWGYRENEPMGGHDPYSSSKGCAELAIASLRRSFFSPSTLGGHPAAVASARAGNVLGGGDWARDRLVPDVLQAFGRGKPVVLRSPGAIRPWQHVLEPLYGYLQLAQRLYEDGAAFAEGWNFGPPEDGARPVSWIVEQLVELWGDGARWEIDSNPQPHEAHYLKLDCSKAAARLHWHPRLDLGTALQWCVDWFRELQAGKDMRDFTLQQIHRYEELISHDL